MLGKLLNIESIMTNITNGKAKRLLTISILENEASYALIANYLKKMGDAKRQVLEATKVYLYPMALAQQPMISIPELELALFQSVQALLGQAVNLLNFFRLYKGITLTPAQLAMLGSMFQYADIAHGTEATNTLVKPSLGILGEEDGADEEDEPQIDPNNSVNIKF
jgi:hypothetical protein